MNTNGTTFALVRENVLFASMSDITISECAKQFTLIPGRRRDCLCRQGDSSSQIYCLLRGSVQISRVGEDGSAFTTRIVGHGGLFGEEAFFEGDAFSSTATLLCDSLLAVCPAERMRGLMARYSQLSLNVARYMHEEHVRALDRLDQTLHKPVRERLLALLYDLASKHDVHSDADDGKCQINLTHIEIASLIGSTRETVSSELGKLVHAGLVTKRGRKIIVDPGDEAA